MAATTEGAHDAAGESRGFFSRVWNAIVAVWAVLTGLAPHVLHHIGPLAGTALVAGAGGQALFAVIGFVATIPMLLRLQRRFSTWLAPAIALLVFAAVFSLSTFVIGPRIWDAEESVQPTDEAEHDSHHGAASEASD